MSKPAKPTPVAVTTVCSMCGLDWHAHGEDPTTEDCIRLLRAELARRPVTVSFPAPYVQRPIYPWPQPVIWSSTTNAPNQATPRLAPGTLCNAVSS